MSPPGFTRGHSVQFKLVKLPAGRTEQVLGPRGGDPWPVPSAPPCILLSADFLLGTRGCRSRPPEPRLVNKYPCREARAPSTVLRMCPGAVLLSFQLRENTQQESHHSDHFKARNGFYDCQVPECSHHSQSTSCPLLVTPHASPAPANHQPTPCLGGLPVLDLLALENGPFSARYPGSWGSERRLGRRK